MAYSIGDVSRVLGMTASALHYYEKEGLIHKPKEEDSGWRSYDEEDVYRLISVKKYGAMGVPLRDIAQQFSKNGMNGRQILDRMKEKRAEAEGMARRCALLSEDIGRLIAVGEQGLEQEAVVDIRPTGDILVFRPSDGGVIPKNKAEQAVARRWLAAQPAVSLGIVRDPARERADRVLLIARDRAKEYGFEPDGKTVFALSGGIALHAVVSCGIEQYDTPDDIFRPLWQFAREHRFEAQGMQHTVCGLR